MDVLGKRDEVFEATVFDTKRMEVRYRPTRMPILTEGHSVLCCLDRLQEDLIYVCRSLEDMQELFDKGQTGLIRNLRWYTGRIVRESNVRVEELGSNPKAVRGIIKDLIPNAPTVVRKAVEAYAAGNPGAARALAEKSKYFRTAEEVEELVGWPLSDHHADQAETIYERFRQNLEA